MGASLNQPSSVQEDGPMGCKLLLYENNLNARVRYCMYRMNKDRLIPCQAAAVIRKVQALSGFIGFKGSVGGLLSVL